MTVDTISFAGYEIFKTCHMDYSDVSCNKTIIQKIGRYNLVFKETYIEKIDSIVDIKKEHLSFLLPAQHFMNPYKASSSIYCDRYINDVPSVIFSKTNEKTSLSVPVEILISINEFINKYTGVTISEKPSLYGDTIIYYQQKQIELKTSKDYSLFLTHAPIGSRANIKFKINNAIIKSIEYIIRKDVEELKCDVCWDSADIDIWENNTLTYSSNDVHFNRTLQLGFHLIKKQAIPSRYLNHTAVISKSTKEQMVVGKKNSGENMDQDVLRIIKEQGAKKNTYFIKPREEIKAREIICDYAKGITDELWLIDSYFTDNQKGDKYLLDWLSIMDAHDIKEKKIIYRANAFTSNSGSPKTFSKDEIKQFLQADKYFSSRLIKSRKIGISFYGLKTSGYIHDRFLIGKSEEVFSGLSIGTSINSLNSNYYCVNKLDSNTAKEILDEVKCLITNASQEKWKI